MFVFQRGRTFNGAGGINMRDDEFHFLGCIAEFDERGRNSVVDDLDDAAANQLLVFDESEIGLNAGGVAIHHEPDGAGGRDDGGLRVAITGALAEFVGVAPTLIGGAEESGRNALSIHAVNRFPVHADHIEKRLLIYRGAGASACGVRRNAGAGEVGLAAHHG